MAIPFRIAETLRRNAISERVSGRRPQVHELRRGDNMLHTRLDAVAAPAPRRDRDVDDPEPRWMLGDLYDVVIEG